MGASDNPMAVVDAQCRRTEHPISRSRFSVRNALDVQQRLLHGEANASQRGNYQGAYSSRIRDGGRRAAPAPPAGRSLLASLDVAACLARARVREKRMVNAIYEARRPELSSR
jgi:hypothetical protein